MLNLFSSALGNSNLGLSQYIYVCILAAMSDSDCAPIFWPPLPAPAASGAWAPGVAQAVQYDPPAIYGQPACSITAAGEGSSRGIESCSGCGTAFPAAGSNFCANCGASRSALPAAQEHAPTHALSAADEQLVQSLLSTKEKAEHGKEAKAKALQQSRQEARRFGAAKWQMRHPAWQR